MEFDAHFESVYGTRWALLAKALGQEEKQILFSPFSGKGLEYFLENPSGHLFESPEDSLIRDEKGFLKNYILDPASLFPVFALGVREGDRVLDLCAAPGGKSLALLSALNGEGDLLSNDSSKDRFIRLRKVLSQYVPQDRKDRLRWSNKDGTKFGFFHKEEFDKILVDVPCSSERHMIHQKRVGDWTLKRSKFLAQKQYTLLCAALLCARPGAGIVYSTCSINPVENDDVVAKFLKKKKNRVELESLPPPSSLGSERTRYGVLTLPDVSGFGPIYTCLLRVL